MAVDLDPGLARIEVSLCIIRVLETYFSAPKTLRRLRGGISGPHIDAFADDLEREGYAPSSAVRYIRAASHLGCFVSGEGVC